MNPQARTRERLLATLVDVLNEALEMNRDDALSHAGTRYEKVALAL